ncbi:von Willebrand factor type A domain-containing protein [Mycena sanguinolenta]|nr:von Willebrand factor type A domain-containing protein [Mycena sanguinolenta]
MIFGLYYIKHQAVSLPLLDVSAEASIKELAAQVKLTQTYGNDAGFPVEAVYAFPIPARAAVCSFVMIKADGTRVVGRVQERNEARETYNTAVTQGRQAALMEQQTPDVFQVAVGKIPSKEQVKIELVYATELSEDEENDSVRFHFPVHIGARYGKPPTSPLSPRNPFVNPFFASAPSKSHFLNITMSVESIRPIMKISCPSHAVSTELGPDPALPHFSELPFSNYARVSHSSNSPLNKDFVLAIKSAGLDSPRCVAELHPDPSHDSVAMALTFVPRFKLPDLARQEFVFLVDRSGSMGNARIAAARKALVVMLRSLPHKDSLFQIMSFGSICTALWDSGSKPYNQDTLEEATRHIDAMDADYGGTEIRRALAVCFATRKRDRPTSVFVLTDGEAWDLDAVLSEVRAAVTVAPRDAPLRVSVLGIGNAVSTAMCEGIARAGHGACMLVGEQETTFTGKIARLLKASRTPVISNISVDWGRPPAEAGTRDDFEMVEGDALVLQEKKTLNVFDETVDPVHLDQTQAPPPPPVVLPPPSAVQQSPFTIRNLFPGVRLHVYSILKGRTVPGTITLRGSTPEGAEIELTVPVTLSRLPNNPRAPTAIHALAARKIVQDLEDGNHALQAALSNPDDMDLLARTVKASIVCLGKKYSISSKHTSFVVDEATPRAPPVVVRAMSLEQYRDMRRAEALSRSRLAASLFSLPSASSPAPRRGRPAPPAPAPAAPDRRSSYDTLASLVLTADRSVLSSPPKLDQTGLLFSTAQGFGDDDWDAIESHDESEEEMLAVVKSTSPPKPKLLPQSDHLEALARMQYFDGGFPAEVFAFVDLKDDSLEAIRALFPKGVGDAIIATVVAMAFLAVKLGPEVERESWEGMYGKAKEYVEEALASSVEWLEAEVARLLL